MVNLVISMHWYGETNYDEILNGQFLKLIKLKNISI